MKLDKIKGLNTLIASDLVGSATFLVENEYESILTIGDIAILHFTNNAMA